MNPEPQIANPEPLAPQRTNPPIHQSTNPSPNSAPHRGNGYVARLPKALRDQINFAIRDGVSYPDIIKSLGDAGQHLKPKHLSEWKNHGHQAWLEEQIWLDDLRAQRESALDLLRENDDTAFQESVIHIALTQIFQSLRKGKLTDDPANYHRMLHALARLSREALVLRKYRDGCAQAAALELKRLDLDRDLNEKERDLMFEQLERFFGFKAGKPIGPPLSELLAQSQTDTDSGNDSGAGVPPAAPPASSIQHPASLNLDPNLDPNPPRATADHSSTQHPASSIEPPPPPVAPAPTEPESRHTEHGLPRQSEAAAGTPNPPATDLASSIQHPASEPASPTQPLTDPASPPPQPPEHCHRCQSLLPPRLPSGERPLPHCPSCKIRLRVPTRPIERCPHCSWAVPELLPNGQRPAPNCPTCHHPLPPPP